MFLDRFKAGSDNRAAAEGAHRKLERERLDEHAQPDRWAAAVDGEVDSFPAQQLNSARCRIGQPFVRRDQRAVDVGDNE